MTALEKAAKAIKSGRGCDADDINCGFCLWGPDERTKEWDETGCIWLARAAIESLRTPGAENSDRIFNAMLDRILKEEV